jgi:transcriptional regulator with XRE-family HTH domain
MTSIRRVLADNIRAYRKEKGLSQMELAEKANISLHHLAMVETEKTWLSSTMLERLALALGRDSFEMFAVGPTQREWQKEILNEIDEFLNTKRETLSAETEKPQPDQH